MIREGGKNSSYQEHRTPFTTERNFSILFQQREIPCSQEADKLVYRYGTVKYGKTDLEHNAKLAFILPVTLVGFEATNEGQGEQRYQNQVLYMASCIC